jgi:hypothetical protein
MEEQQKLSFRAALDVAHVEGNTLAILAASGGIPQHALDDMIDGKPVERAYAESMRAALAKDFSSRDWRVEAVEIPLKQRLSVLINTSPITAQTLISRSGLNPDLVLAAVQGKKVHPQVAEKLLQAVNEINQTTHTITNLTADSCFEPVYSIQAAPFQGISQEGIDEQK